MRVFNFCFLVVAALFLGIHQTFSKKMSVTVNEYFPELNREISRVTWAHAVNSHEELKQALNNDEIMMLEADILMGTHGHFEDLQPIMAHPPSQSSDLTFLQFLQGVLEAVKLQGKRKGIKLDFKDINAVEPSLKILQSRLEESDAPVIPIFINADILQGPVNSTKKPLNPEIFISLAKQYASWATLSVGWTTRFGSDNSSEEIREGKYTKIQMKEMLKTLRIHAGDPPVFPHITFPVRAGLAAYSIEELLYLTSRIRSENSITIWSPQSDPINRKLLRSLIQQTTARHCFIDLPFSIEDSALDEEEEGFDDPNHSAIQMLEGRGQPEGATSAAASSTTFLSVGTLIPILTIGVITAYMAYRRL